MALIPFYLERSSFSSAKNRRAHEEAQQMMDGKTTTICGHCSNSFVYLKGFFLTSQTNNRAQEESRRGLRKYPYDKVIEH